MGYVRGKSIGEAYIKALKFITENKIPYWYIIIHISNPIRDIPLTHKISSLEIKDWVKLINVEDEVFSVFSKFRFSKPDSWTGGYTGKDWINGRIKDLLHPDGYYNKALKNGYSFDQLNEIEKRLCVRDKKGRRIHGGTANALVCHVFLPHEDLRKACLPRPRA